MHDPERPQWKGGRLIRASEASAAFQPPTQRSIPSLDRRWQTGHV